MANLVTTFQAAVVGRGIYVRPTASASQSAPTTGQLWPRITQQ